MVRIQGNKKGGQDYQMSGKGSDYYILGNILLKLMQTQENIQLY